ncbi:hypothetical protein ABBQ38_004721 [Trebouxia sp. C0009 RCD-2024]
MNIMHYPLDASPHSLLVTVASSQHLTAAWVSSEPAAPVTPPADVDLLEKAFQLYQDTCLSSEPQSCWDGAVQPALHAALTFHPPDTAALLGDASISPEMFHKYALAYIQALGLSSAPDKLHDLQQRLKRLMRRSNASAEACQSLHTAATAAEQVALDRQLGQLEAQVQDALQSASLQLVNDVPDGEAVAGASQQAAAPDDAALDEFFGIQPAADAHIAWPVRSTLTESKAMQEADQPEAMQLSDQPQIEQQSEALPAGTAPADTTPADMAPADTAPAEIAPPGTAPPGTAPPGTAPPGTAPPGTAAAGTAPAEVPHKELLLALLVLLKRYHGLWKGMGAKGDAGHVSARQAELQMNRAYMAYMRLGWPDKPAHARQGMAAANAVEHLLQQGRSGVAIPVPIEQ